VTSEARSTSIYEGKHIQVGAGKYFARLEKSLAMNTRTCRACFSLICLVFSCCAVASAQGYAVQVANDAPPQALSPAVRDTLSPQAMRVTGPGGNICEIWVRKSVPGVAPVQQLGITYTQLQEGTLVGAIQFSADIKDYRRQTVHAGVYTLRYALSPVNGNHQGVAPQRDFLLASPAAVDQDPAGVSAAQTIELSKKSTSTNHASVWLLAAGDGGTSAAPAITHDSDNDFWIAQFSISVAAGAAAAPVRMGLVVVGSGPEV